MSHIDSTLNERGRRYGDFSGHAEITQGLKEVMQSTANWAELADDQKEALEMTAHKIGRILNGDPNYLDSWHDIIGYIRLVEQRLEMREKAKNPVKQDSAQTGAQNLKAERCLDCGEVHEGAITHKSIEDLVRSMGYSGELKVIFLDEESDET